MHLTRVAVEAAERMDIHARAQLAPEVALPAAVSPLDDALASLGAALAANDLANIARHMHAAFGLGASRSQLQEAIEVAQNVQQNAARIHLREAERLLETTASPVVAGGGGDCDDDCPCHADEAATVAVETEPCAGKASREQSPPASRPTGDAAEPAGLIAGVAVSAEGTDP